MTRTPLKKIACIIAAISLAGAAPSALGSETPVANYLSSYLHNYKCSVNKGQLQNAGRNIVLYGYRHENGKISLASKTQVKESNARLKALCHPAPVVVPTTTTYTTEPATSSSTSVSSTSSSTVECESGGDYSANTGNGYYGGYQFDSGTWDAYGDSAYAEASDAPPAVQDSAAASVPYDAWPNC
jgi:hypothetical protein